MKGDNELIEMLDKLLVDELTAINQYMVHSEMCDNWGYVRLHKKVEERAMQEMKHAEKLIARILFLEGTPTVGTLNKVHIGSNIPEQIANDLREEMGAVRSYSDAIKLADRVGDAATREMLEDILQEEDGHVDWLEEQQDQIKQMGLELYLSTQSRE